MPIRRVVIRHNRTPVARNSAKGSPLLHPQPGDYRVPLFPISLFHSPRRELPASPQKPRVEFSSG